MKGRRDVRIRETRYRGDSHQEGSDREAEIASGAIDPVVLMLPAPRNREPCLTGRATL
jgi:hypothetical protein